jgi:hypothetical protein
MLLLEWGRRFNVLTWKHDLLPSQVCVTHMGFSIAALPGYKSEFLTILCHSDSSLRRSSLRLFGSCCLLQRYFNLRCPPYVLSFDTQAHSAPCCLVNVAVTLTEQLVNSRSLPTLLYLILEGLED